MTEVSADISKLLKIIARYGDTFNLSINVNNLDGSAYDFTGHTVTLDVYNPADREPCLSFSYGEGLTLSSGLISLEKTVSEMNPLRRGERIYFLRVTFPDSSKKLWLNGPFVTNEGIFTGSDNAEATISIGSQGDVITVTVGSITGSNLPIPIEIFAQELKFNHDKELAFNEGGALSFTLSDSENINGAGIVLKLNTPTSVSFSADFQAMPNSQAFDSTKMNITTLVYFSDFDGQGGEKVLYNNNQLTAI